MTPQLLCALLFGLLLTYFLDGTLYLGIAAAQDFLCLGTGIVNNLAMLGADAVVGIDIDYEVLGENGGMLMVTASGTAVRLS